MACLFAFTEWRRGIYVGILIDVLRDPVRKLVPEQPVIITLSGVLVWLCVVLTVLLAHRDQLRLLYQKYPRLRTAMHLLLMALIPAAGISMISYSHGWLMAAIGGLSYLIPTLGILAGFSFLRKEVDVANLMIWYVLVNAVMLTSVLLEYFGAEVPALGGIDHIWIRYRTGYIVDLMCGWYRSPDIMGLHAAHVIMFSVVLAMRPQSHARFAWLVPVLWAAFSVLLSGRRKMIGIPLVFVATYLLLGMIYRVTRVSRVTGFVLVSGLIGGSLSLFLWAPEDSVEYTDFASTLFTEGAERSNEVIIGSTISTLKQVGVIGGGLGTATQGRYYAGIQTARNLRGWQEDGVSRLFIEFGVPGVLLLVGSLTLLIGALMRSLRSLPTRSPEILMQLALVAVVAGDAASFAISHQQFSGDPVNALFVTLMVGMILRFPGTLSRPQPQSPATTEVAANEGLLQVAQSNATDGDARPISIQS